MMPVPVSPVWLEEATNELGHQGRQLIDLLRQELAELDQRIAHCDRQLEHRPNRCVSA